MERGQECVSHAVEWDRRRTKSPRRGKASSRLPELRRFTATPSSARGGLGWLCLSAEL